MDSLVKDDVALVDVDLYDDGGFPSSATSRPLAPWPSAPPYEGRSPSRGKASPPAASYGRWA